MPLGRGRTIGYNVSRMTFDFTMMDDKARLVTCEISSVAMDQLAGTRGALPAEREAQFLHLRDRIERIASELFDGMPMPPAGRPASSTIMFGTASCASAPPSARLEPAMGPAPWWLPNLAASLPPLSARSWAAGHALHQNFDVSKLWTRERAAH
jgi:hypothetical protein